jgi:hypothetical protein
LLMNYYNNNCVFTKKKENTKTYATKKGGFETGKYLCYMKIVPPRVKFWLVRFKITIGDHRGTSFLRERFSATKWISMTVLRCD